MSAISRFRQNFFRVARANVLSQVMLLAAAPILSRLYLPEYFGLAAFFLAALQITVAVSTLRFDRSIPNRLSHGGASALIISGGAVLLVSCSLIVLLIVTEPAPVRWWKGFDALGSLLWWLPVALMAACAHQLLSGWHVRERELKAVSFSKVAHSGTYLVVALLAPFFSLGAGGLILATTTAWWVSAGVLLRKTPTLLQSSIARLTTHRVVTVTRGTIRLSATAASVSLLNTISLTSAVLLLAQAYRAREVGWYALMARLVSTPVGAITSALALAFWSRAAELARSRSFSQMKRLYLRVTAIMLVPVAGVILVCTVGPRFVAPVLGDEWAGAAPVLTALTPLLIGSTLFSPTNHLIVLNRQSLQLIADGTRLSLMILTIYVATSQDWPFVHAVLGVAVSSLIGHILLFIMHLVSYRQLEKSRSLPE